MSSIRISTRRLRGDGASHCLVEWNEPGKPINVVEMKQVSDEQVTIGEMAKVYVTEGRKKSLYEAKIPWNR